MNYETRMSTIKAGIAEHLKSKGLVTEGEHAAETPEQEGFQVVDPQGGERSEDQAAADEATAAEQRAQLHAAAAEKRESAARAAGSSSARPTRR